MKKTISFLLLLVFCIMNCITLHAKTTGIGVPAKKSYVKKQYSGRVIVFVGDSRVMMSTSGKGHKKVRDNFYMCWVNGGNVTVLKKNQKLTPYVKKAIDKYREKCVVVFNMGVNGNSSPKKNAKRIIKIYRRWMKEYPDVPFYVMSVNPTIETSGPYANSKVIKVNRYLKNEYDPKGIYIDCYRYLREKGIINNNGKGMKDKYHYKWSTSRKIMQYVRNTVEKKEEEKRTNVQSAR